MAATGLHISLSAETLTTIGGLAITNSMFTSLLVSGALITFAFIANSQLKKTDKPSGLQNFVEMIIEGLYSVVAGVAGSEKKARSFFPLFATFFLWIILNNYAGLLPGVGTIGLVFDEGEHAQTATQVVHAAETAPIEEALEGGELQLEGDDLHTEETEDGAHADEEEGHTTFVPIFRPATADLNTTLALGIISIFMTQVIGVRYLGLHYFKKFINFSSPINFYVGILELISEFAKIVSFAFRLFGNIFAGEVLLVVMGALVPLVAPMPFYGLEIFVGFIQALVFAMLSLVFFNMATHSHDEH